MQKRGQFYLLAAIVIIAVIVGFAGVSNYTQVQSHETVYNVGEELGIEGGNVVEYDIGQADQAGKRIEKFIEKYSTYSDEEKRDIIFIYGNSDSLRGVSYQELVTGSISIGIDQAVSISGTIPVDIESKISEKKITVNFKGTDDTTEIPYEFKIKPGENFYFVVIQDVGDERVVIQSE